MRKKLLPGRLGYIVFAAVAAALLAVLSALPVCAFPWILPGSRTAVSFTVTCDSGSATFYEGVSFDTAGYTGVITYSDGSTVTILSEDLAVTPGGPLEYSENAFVTFSCDKTTLTCDYAITVVPLDGLVIGGAYSTAYRAAEDCLDTENMTAELTYSDGHREEISVSDCLFSSDISQPLAAGTSYVRVFYTLGSKTVYTDVAVAVHRALSLTVTGTPNKKYREGDIFTCTNDEITVYAKYEGYAEETQVKNFEISGNGSPIQASGEGFATMSVALDGISATFKIDIVNVVNFTVSSESFMNLYCGDSFTPEGIKILVNYSDGTSANISQDVNYSYTGPVTFGRELKATWAFYEIPLDSVLKVHTAELVVLKGPDKSEYNVGERFDPTGTVLIVSYDDGTTYRPDLSACTFTYADPLSETDSSADVEWNGLKGSLTFKVYPSRRMDRIEIVTPPDNLSYISGQPVDITGLKVNIWYVGEALPVEATADQIVTLPAAGEPVEDGTLYLTVRVGTSASVYCEALQAIEVVKKEISNIVVIKQPQTTKYYEGSTFNPDGMAVRALYNDGTTAEITGYTVSPDGPIVLSSGDSMQVFNITVSYEGFECLVPVTVYAKEVKSLAFISQPKKLIYRVGESFDPDGLKVVLNYSDTNLSPVILDETQYVYSPTGRLTADVNTIYVTFRGLTASIPIEVTASGQHEEETTEESKSVTSGVYTMPVTPVTSGTPIETSAPETEKTAAPVVTTSPSETTHGQSGKTHGGGLDSITVLWIVIIAIIFVSLVVLIIYYKRHFT